MVAARPKGTPIERSNGVALLLLALALLVANHVLASALGLYFPMLLLAVGPLVTMGSLTTVHPRFFNVLLEEGELTKLDKARRLVSLAALMLGIVLGVLLITTYRGDV